MTAKSHHGSASFPALSSLGLGGEHLAALARQGTLHATGSPSGKQCFTLRFRMDAQQQVRYVGTRPEFAARVRWELEQLQARTRVTRELKRLIREARKRLRETKHRLEPLLPLAGRCFYGREIRPRPGHRDVSVE